MKTIKVETPKYESSSGACRIELSDLNAGKSIINIDLETILPFATLVSKEVLDFFFISSMVYGIDRFVERKRNSVDGWTREIEVIFPVHNSTKWNPCKEELNKLLSFITGDYWKVDFKETKIDIPTAELLDKYAGPFTQVNLLSGGLDSLIGAINILKSNPTNKVFFVSHYDPQMHGTLRDQGKIVTALEALYPNQLVKIPSVRVYSEYSNEIRESTFRSRSILFIGLALLISQATNTEKIIIPENGTVSLNYPLSKSRRSSCSTRTTHPFVLEKVLSIWKILSISSNIKNPYELQTKSEMVMGCLDQVNLSNLISLSNSCGKRGHRAHWKVPGASHCGVCMPCIYRRVALNLLIDKSTYGNSINSLDPFITKKAQDVGACLDFLNTPLKKEEIKQELIVNGIKNLSKLDEYADVVWRTRLQLSQWVKSVGNSSVKAKAGV
jgi:7-cyano-7-deazaguanine synthase in queuosine biosynthesis